MPTLSLLLDNSLSNINYLIYCPETRDCLVIDPLDCDKILQTAQEQELKISQIINTHEHADHTGGNLELKEKIHAKIQAHHRAKNLIPGFDRGLKHQDLIQIGSTLTFKVLETPGHTLHSICIYNEAEPALYTGDTLFNCGCGNCYHGGDPELMFQTFENQLQHLPNETVIYPGHDYLRNNLQFAASLTPNHPGINNLENKLKASEFYLSTLGEDKSVDPFFRLDENELIKAINKVTPLPEKPSRKEVFLALRHLRNEW